MDPDTIIIVCAVPIYGIICVAIAKMTLTMFESQQIIQTTETATVPAK